MSVFEIIREHFPARFPDDTRVGDVVTLTVKARIYSIEEDLVDTTSVRDRAPSFLPGRRRIKLMIQDIK